MGVVEAGLILGGALGAVGAGASYMQAQENNKSIKRAKAATTAANDVQNKQLTAQAAQAREKRLRESAAIRGRVLAAGGASGFDIGSGDVSGLVTENTATTGIDLQTLYTNLQNRIAYGASATNAELINLDSRTQNAGLGAFQGGLTGFSTGLSLAGSYYSLEQASKMKAQYGDRPDA